MPAPTLFDVIVTKLKAAVPDVQRDVLRFIEAIETKEALQDARFEDSFEPFFGLTQGAYVFDGDPVDLQRKLRSTKDQ